MNQQVDFEALRRLSADIRIETTRAIGEAGFGHIGGSASIADVLAVLYGNVMNIDPKNPDYKDRDWFVLSKGHSGPALYAVLALKGYFPKDWLKTINKPGTRLPSHADRLKTPGVDMTTGSLGQGFSAAVGIAMGNRIQNRDSYTYCIIGDGETNEGQIWEAAQAAVHFNLDKLIVFIDWNKKQLDGRLEEISNPINYEDKFRSFGFDAKTVKGYDVEAIHKAINEAKSREGVPHAIVLDTIKGLGVNLAEDKEFNHYLTFGPKEAEIAIEEIERRFEDGSYPGGDFEW